jgi:hypothetical protein
LLLAGVAPDDLPAEFEVVDDPRAGEGYRAFRVPAALANTWPRRMLP